jgi:hypothetical protein
MKKLISLILFLLITIFCYSQEVKRLEKDYQKVFAEYIHGQTEYVLEDRARVDIITEQYAIEVDYAHKWAESIGQSLYYGMMTNRFSGVLLIITEYDGVYINRLVVVAKIHNIKIWTINKNTLEIKELILSN